MKVKTAKRIGFCFGVKRAIDMAEKSLARYKNVYSFGSIIHNKQVVDALSKRGLKVIKSIRGIKDGVIVISSHGISPKEAAKIRKIGLRLVDTTCPFVRNAQRIARDLSDSGYEVIIVGDSDHPEVRALVDFVPGRVYVIKDKEEATKAAIRPNSKISLISQTTQSVANFLEVAKAILDKMPKELKIVNTICKDVEERQRGALALAGSVDAMLVIGGPHSANTRRLFEICKPISRKAYFIQSEDDVKKAWFKPRCVIGIASGASTPDRVVRDVVKKITKKGRLQ